ncbi:phage portal protein [Bradyrhizobium barranii subsp. apii]|uniref:phage portal protein n=1 Tax=Bradyrhizobium barranii TaxID=2992140 RepID=UPI001AA17A13|nr:phage portal protein [Bradyrhizobium barranii]UPT93024.1 phage portal protein [Bradyrhizobium barranii subsp. apii]
MWPFRKKVEERIASSDPFLGEFLGARWQARADIEKASGHSVAASCIAAITGNLSAVPLKLYKHTDDGGREPATDHPLYEVLQTQASPTLTAFEAREWLVANVLMYGNGYARIERNGRAQVTGLQPLVAGSVTVECLPNGRLRYKHARKDGGTEVLLQEEVLHLRYRTSDGVCGMSPIQIAAATFGLALSQQDTAGAAAENSFRPAGALVFPEKLALPAKGATPAKGAGNAEDIVAKFKEKFVGALKANEVMVLDGGAKFETFSFNSKDSEFLESRKLSNMDICRVFGVPPSVAGITDNSTYSNSGEESRALVTRCLAPMAKRIEQAMNVALLTPESRKSFFIEHDLNALTRGDLAQRYAAYAIGRNNGWLNVDEIRKMENMSKVPGGDTFVVPLNVTSLAAANDNKNKIDGAA